MKKEVESEFFGLSKQELEIYKLNFPQKIEFLRRFVSKIDSNKLEMLVS